MLQFNNKKGFSLIEILVVIALIGILTSIILINRNPITANARIASAVNIVTNFAETTRQKSVSVGVAIDTLGVPNFPSYGLYFDVTPPNNNKVFEFVDCVDDDNGSGKVDSDDYFGFDINSYDQCSSSRNKLNQTISLEKGVIIKSIKIERPSANGAVFEEVTPSPVKAAIEYLRPEPTIWISGDTSVIPSSRLIITLEDSNSLSTKEIIFLNTGLIKTR